MFTLTRTGDAPLRFEGALVAQAGDCDRGGRELTRWHELTLYRTEGGRHVLAVNFMTRWGGERDVSTVEIVDSPEAVVDMLRAYDPVTPASPFPPGPAYADKQARLVAGLVSQYQAAVSDLLGQVADTFAETLA
jgi:hypothetical protein